MIGEIRIGAVASSKLGWRRIVGQLMVAVLLLMFGFGGQLAHSKSVTIAEDSAAISIVETGDDHSPQEHSDFCPIPGHGKQCTGHTALNAAAEATLTLGDLVETEFTSGGRLLTSAEVDPPKEPPRA